MGPLTVRYASRHFAAGLTVSDGSRGRIQEPG